MPAAPNGARGSVSFTSASDSEESFGETFVRRKLTTTPEPILTATVDEWTRFTRVVEAPAAAPVGAPFADAVYEFGRFLDGVSLTPPKSGRKLFASASAPGGFIKGGPFNPPCEPGSQELPMASADYVEQALKNLKEEQALIKSMATLPSGTGRTPVTMCPKRSCLPTSPTHGSMTMGGRCDSVASTAASVTTSTGGDRDNTEQEDLEENLGRSPDPRQALLFDGPDQAMEDRTVEAREFLVGCIDLLAEPLLDGTDQAMEARAVEARKLLAADEQAIAKRQPVALQQRGYRDFRHRIDVGEYLYNITEAARREPEQLDWHKKVCRAAENSLSVSRKRSWRNPSSIGGHGGTRVLSSVSVPLTTTIRGRALSGDWRKEVRRTSERIRSADHHRSRESLQAR